MFSVLNHSTDNLLEEDTRKYRQLVRIHLAMALCGWVILVTLCILIRFLAPEGGISNLGMHSLIFAIQITLMIIGLLLTIFWEGGLSRVALNYVRGRRNRLATLTDGFHSLKPLGSSILFRAFQYTLAYFLCSSATGLALSLLPFSSTFYADVNRLLEKPSTPLEGRIIITAGVYGFVFVSILIFFSSQLFYRYRLTRYIILDDDNVGGLKACFLSHAMIKGHKKALFLLDLRFWWFYLVKFLGLMMPLAMTLIYVSEIKLPVHLVTPAWIVAASCFLLQLAVQYFAKPKVTAAYALFYERLLKQESEPVVENGPSRSDTKEPPKPENVPWKY